MLKRLQGDTSDLYSEHPNSIYLGGRSILSCNLMLLIPLGFFRMQTFSIWVNFTLRISLKPHYIFFSGICSTECLGVMIRGKSVILCHRTLKQWDL